MKTSAPLVSVLMVLCLLAFVPLASAEVILQYFETEWEEIYRRLPEISEIGYGGIWHPSPAKSPVSGGQFAGGGNVGYSLFDRFDIGDVPQRGDRATRYGSRGQLRRMVDNAHQTDIKIYPDIIMNHAGNGPHFWTYPGMKPNDFHGWWNSNEPGGFRRAPRMNNYGEINNGYGRTFQEELVSLIDIVTERDNRFSTGAPNYATPDEYVRQPGQYDLYPFHGPGDALPNEHPVDFLGRWINWLGYAMDFDGVRLDAPKHVIADFFGTPGWGFNHEIQFNYKHRRGWDNWTNVDELYQNGLRRRDSALIFSEFFIGDQSEIDYWRNFGVKMRYLDFPRKSQMIWPAFNNGNLAALSSFAGFSPAEGVMFAQSHDENPPWKLELAYAYILTRVGVPIVYTTGNNLAGGESKVNTWMLVGHEGALGDWGHQAIPNLVYINNNFARGNEWERWSEGDFYAFERYEDLNGNGTPQAGEGLLLVGLNDSGGDLTRTVQTAFEPLTVLHDYTGNAGVISVKHDGTVDLTVPGMGGQGFVAYAPKNVDGPAAGEPLRFAQGGTPVGEIDWIVPGGRLAADKPRTLPRVTGDTVDIDVHFATGGPTADNVMIKWGEGDLPANIDTDTYYYDGGFGIVSGGFQNSQEIAPGHWRLTADTTRFPEGLHVIRARVFNERDPGLPALYQTFSKVIYLDRQGPDIEFANLDAGQTVRGAPMIEIANPDRLAATVEYSTDGSTFHPADKVIAGFWQFALPALPAGAQTLTIRAREYDWDEPRKQINETIATRNFTVDASGPAIAIEFDHHVRPADAASGEIHMPFFTVKVVTDAGKPASQVRLFWNEYEMVGLSGTGEISTTFDGRFMLGSEEGRLWGSFVNGAHVFEAMVEHNGEWYHASRRAVFNLYGQNLIDSDGDGIPDTVEMPFFETGTAPGYGQKWPGDNNEDMIPNDGEYWTRLNPMNHDTTYSGSWDGDEDWSGDGYSNLYKVRRGYWDEGDAYFYGIYQNHAGQLGDEGDWDWGGGGGGGGGLPGLASWNPPNPDRCPGSTLTLTYDPREGTLEGVSPIHVHLGFNGFEPFEGHFAMTDQGNGTWQYIVNIPEDAYQVNFVFRNAEGTLWDNNNGNDWNVSVSGCGAGGPEFTMDGALDSEHYELAHYNGMRLWAAVRDTKLYVATWGTGGGGNDHMIYINDQLGDAVPSAWAKAGYVFLGPDHIFLAGDGVSSWSEWSGTVGDVQSANSKVDGTFNYLEGVIDLVQEFGTVPEALYMAVGTYARPDGSPLNNQVPAPWDVNEHIEVTEFLRVPIASIRDQNGDGHFDGGNPLMWTVVNGDTNNANYGLRRFFLDEVAGDQEWLTVIVEPRAGGTNQITEIEVFSNLNRRDFAKLPGEENPDDVTAASLDTYFRGWPMQSIGGGQWSATLPVNQCGAYRINARWRINGGPWTYYTDEGLRRDTAVVVSPKKALDTVLYELNPLTAESTTHEFGGRSTFRNMYTTEGGRPNAISPTQLQDLGVNMIWLQPIHPIGTIGRQTDPLTGQPYDPGSPYAVRNYWAVNSVLGDPATRDQAMTEFVEFVDQYNQAGIGIMLDGTFNHSAWDCEIGVMATQMGLVNSHGNPLNPDSLISEVRPGWYSKKDSYGEPATYFVSMENNDIAEAPDRIDFGKWSDAADFFFGRYDALVQYPAADPDPLNAWFSSWHQRFLREDDRLEPLGPQTQELWDYFANYSLYWLEKTGLPPGQPIDQQDTGIAGLRCDFAQGLPNEFWEYTINRTRSVKWDFLFMAESLDGFRVVDGSPRHGVGYRSARHFDILNENIVFMWRDQYFSYRVYESTGYNPNKSTGLIFGAFDDRKNAFELSPLLLNLTSHDEVFPSDDQYSLLFAYAINAAMDGVPMIFYGQEMGAQNYATEYGPRTDSPDGISPDNNFSLYEENFGKFIPNFKRYNHMSSVWAAAAWKDNIRGIYSRLNKARQNSPALRSQQNYFLDDFNVGGWNNDIFAVAKFQQPGISAAEQDVVFVFVNNDFRGDPNRAGLFDVSATTPSGANWFGINPTHNYNVVNIAATNPTTLLWGAGIMGSDLIANGIYVGFNEGDATWVGGNQAQYIRLLDITAGMTAESVNDYVPPRFAAPVIQAIGNQSVEAGNTLSFNVNVTVAPGDSVTLTAQSDLAPNNWSFTAPNAFSFTPVPGEVGVHTFLFTATGLDGYDEEWITITVTSDSPPLTPYQTWLGTYGIDPQAPLAGPNDDFDGDGYTNEEEFRADTHPNDDESYPSINVFRKDSQGRWRIEMQKGSAATRSYTVHRAAELDGDGWDWTPHVTIPRTDGVLTVDPVAPPLLIFKVTIEPPAP